MYFVMTPGETTISFVLDFEHSYLEFVSDFVLLI